MKALFQSLAFKVMMHNIIIVKGDNAISIHRSITKANHYLLQRKRKSQAKQ